MTTRSHVNHNACLWEPQEHEISLALVPETDLGKTLFPFDRYWCLHLSPDISVGLGRHAESVASDAAAMRKLAAMAAELAGELERRAVGQAAGASDG